MNLVERVENAIEAAIQNHGYGPHVPRAAIREVAAWMHSIGHDKAIVSDLLKQLDRQAAGGGVE